MAIWAGELRWPRIRDRTPFADTDTLARLLALYADGFLTGISRALSVTVRLAKSRLPIPQGITPVIGHNRGRRTEAVVVRLETLRGRRAYVYSNAKTVAIMGSLGHGGFKERLPPLRAHPAEPDLALARSALMWLSAAQRPLRACELWIALQAGDGNDYEQVKRVLTESAHLDEEEAVLALWGVLGGLISTRPDVDGPGSVYVSLADIKPSNSWVSKNEVRVWDSPLSFSTSHAHLFVTRVCMAICGSTTLFVAPVRHTDSKTSAFITYAWDHWRTHLSLSGCALKDDDVASSVDRMIQGVCTDTLVLLLALNDFITRPITFPAHHGRARCHVLVKGTQTVLARPILLLSRLVRQQRYSRTLETARETFEATKNCGSTLQAAAGGMSIDSQPTSTLKARRLDNLLKSLGPLLGEHEGLMIQSYADVANGLRSAALVFSQSPLYEALREEYNSGVSPLGVLAKVARWVEIVASYPFWSEILPDSCASLVSKELSVSDHGAKDLEPIHTGKGRSGDSETAILQLAGISPIRWNTARLIYKIKGLSSRSSTITVNSQRPKRPSSFASFPAAMADMPSPIVIAALYLYHRLMSLPSTSIRRFYHCYLHRDITHLRNHALFTPPSPLHRLNTAPANPPKPLSGSCPGAGVGIGARTGNGTPVPGQVNNHSHVYGYDNRPTLLSSFSITHILLAATLNHIRRTLIPWLGGGYLWQRHPLEDLRLAISNPEAFIQEMLEGGWWRVGWRVMGCYIVKWVVDLLGGLLRREVELEVMGMVEDEEKDGVRSAGVGMDAVGDGGVGGAGKRRRYMRLSHIRRGRGDVEVGKEMWLEVARVGYLLWMFTTAEYVFARGMNTAAWLVACYKLLAGGEVGCRVLGIVLTTNWHNIPLTLWLLAYHLRKGCWLLMVESVRCAVQGQPGVLMAALGAAGVVTALLKYRSTFYIALQISGMFVFFGFVLAGLTVLGLETWSDPLGVRVSTELARARGNRGGNALAHREM